MNNLFYLGIGLVAFFIAGIAFASKITQEEVSMTATGKFEVSLEPQKDEAAPAGRMIINKSYSGVLAGSGVGQMISKRTENGNAIYYAIEEFNGSLGDKNGEFTLVHRGIMGKASQSLEVNILEGSGKGQLEGITGLMIITNLEDGSHLYELKYQL